MRSRAVFLDRDGVLNELVHHPGSAEYVSPWVPEELRLIDGIFPPLQSLVADGWKLFVVSNQPAYAKKQTTMEHLSAIHRQLDAAFRENGIPFTDYYYCYHHPCGLVPEYSGPCPCRKPSPFFLRKARDEHGIDLGASWMVGDRDTDVACGQAAGCHTIRVVNPWTVGGGVPRPDIVAATLAAAVDSIRRDVTVVE
jgi:D-glycero-D-manno-heptose 1,7-bisphosphate phosphatase